MVYLTDKNLPSDATTARIKYIGDDGSAPRAFLDGKEVDFDSLYAINSLRNGISNRLKVESPLEITLATDGTKCILKASNTSTAAVTGKLFVILIENGIAAPSSDWDVKTAYGIPRKAINAAAGEDVTIAAGKDVSKEYTYTLNSSWKKENCKCIAFVQKTDKEVVQVKEVALLPIAVNNHNVQSIHQSSLKVVRGTTQSDGVTISFHLSNESPVSVSIYDAKGARVGSLSRQFLQSGNQSLIWDMKNTNNRMLPKGVYYFVVETTGFKSTAKAVL